MRVWRPRLAGCGTQGIRLAQARWAGWPFTSSSCVFSASAPGDASPPMLALSRARCALREARTAPFRPGRASVPYKATRSTGGHPCETGVENANDPKGPEDLLRRGRSQKMPREAGQVLQVCMCPRETNPGHSQCYEQTVARSISGHLTRTGAAIRAGTAVPYSPGPPRRARCCPPTEEESARLWEYTSFSITRPDLNWADPRPGPGGSGLVPSALECRTRDMRSGSGCRVEITVP
jgi:hypothetical protein